MDAEPISHELEKDFNALTSITTAGNDADPLKLSPKKGKPALLLNLHELMKLCWSTGSSSRYERCRCVTFFKNKGDRSDFSNYRRISLLSIVGKVFARVLRTRLQELLEHVHPAVHLKSSPSQIQSNPCPAQRYTVRRCCCFASHTLDGLQRPINNFIKACDDFRLTISIKRT